MKLTLSKPLKNLSDQPLQEGGRTLVMSECVANALAQAQNQNAVKCYDLALRFFSGQPVEIDDTDFAMVRDVVEKSQYIPLVKGPILKEMDAQKLAVSAR